MAKGIKKYDATKFLQGRPLKSVKDAELDGLADGVDTFTDSEIVQFDAIAPTDDDIQDELNLMGTFLND
tara:strand:- start:427 stop:633 length:207 start_codon:yes stop_codon:yes gene_type:complete